MKLLNREVDYAVRALVLMSRNGPAPLAVSGMKGDADVSGPFLRKIMQKLHKAGLVRAAKGKGGGFTAARAPGEITLAGVAAALQGPVTLADCVFRRKLCRNHRTCRLRGKLLAMETRLRGEMEAITIKDLV